MARKGIEFVTMYLTPDIKVEWENERSKPENHGLSQSEILKRLIRKDTDPTALHIDVDDITRQRLVILRGYYGKREDNIEVSDTIVIRNAIEEKAREVRDEETNTVRLTKLYTITLRQDQSFQEMRDRIIELLEKLNHDLPSPR